MSVGATIFRLRRVTSAFTATWGQFLLANASTGAFAITLPRPSIGLGGIAIKKEDSSTNAITITPSSGALIDGAANLVISKQNDVVHLVPDGKNWQRLSNTTDESNLVHRTTDETIDGFKTFVKGPIITASHDPTATDPMLWFKDTVFTGVGVKIFGQYGNALKLVPNTIDLTLTNPANNSRFYNTYEGIYLTSNLSTTAKVWHVEATLGRMCIGAGNPEASAQLEIRSTTRGFLPPKMTTTQRNAIASPVAGLTIYNTTTARLEIYSGTAWGPVDVGPVSVGPNVITGIWSGTQAQYDAIGTKDSAVLYFVDA